MSLCCDRKLLQHQTQSSIVTGFNRWSKKSSKLNQTCTQMLNIIWKMWWTQFFITERSVKMNVKLVNRSNVGVLWLWFCSYELKRIWKCTRFSTQHKETHSGSTNDEHVLYSATKINFLQKLNQNSVNLCSIYGLMLTCWGQMLWWTLMLTQSYSLKQRVVWLYWPLWL